MIMTMAPRGMSATLEKALLALKSWREPGPVGNGAQKSPATSFSELVPENAIIANNKLIQLDLS